MSMVDSCARDCTSSDPTGGVERGDVGASDALKGRFGGERFPMDEFDGECVGDLAYGVW